MKQEYINEGNKLIAYMVGEKIDLNKWGENWKKIINQYTTNETPNYHSSWDWFIPAFNKIQKIKHDKEFCDLILAYVRHNDHENAFKCLVNYINIVIHNKPIKSPLIEAAKGLEKYLKK